MIREKDNTLEKYVKFKRNDYIVSEKKDKINREIGDVQGDVT